MNDVERLAEELRRANAELAVDPAELAEAVKHAHRRLVRRLLLVATLSAVASALLLSGGLAASSVIKTNRGNSDDNNSTQSKGGHKKHHEAKANVEHGGGSDSNTNGHHGGGHGEKEREGKQPDKSERTSGGGTEAPAEKLPELVIAEVTETEVEVRNESPYDADSFYVLVTIPGQEFEEELIFDKGLAGRESSRRKLEEFQCSGEQQIVAVVDAGRSVLEAEDENNTGEATCKGPLGVAEEKSPEEEKLPSSP